MNVLLKHQAHNACSMHNGYGTPYTSRVPQCVPKNPPATGVCRLPTTPTLSESSARRGCLEPLNPGERRCSDQTASAVPVAGAVPGASRLACMWNERGGWSVCFFCPPRMPAPFFLESLPPISGPPPTMGVCMPHGPYATHACSYLMRQPCMRPPGVLIAIFRTSERVI